MEWCGLFVELFSNPWNSTLSLHDALPICNIEPYCEGYFFQQHQCNDLQSVSYTHLDVYKRQQDSLLDRQDKCIQPKGILENFNLTGSSSNWVAPGAPLSGTCSNSFANITVQGLSLIHI